MQVIRYCQSQSGFCLLLLTNYHLLVLYELKHLFVLLLHRLNRFCSIAVSFCLGMTSFSQPLLFSCQTTAALAASRFPKLLVLPLYELQPLITVFLNQLRLNPEKYLTA